MVKEILTGTATDIGSPADQQGAGLLNVDAAVRAARQEPGSTLSHQGTGRPTPAAWSSVDGPMTFWLLDPTGKVVQQVAGAPATDASGVTVAAANLVATSPVAGRWEIDVELNLTTSGKEFTQLVHGVAGYPAE